MSTKQPHPIDRFVGARIRMRRLEVGLSQEKLGGELGLTFQQVQKYEKGTNRIGSSRLAHIAGILSVDVAYFYRGAPGMTDTGSQRSGLDDFISSSDGMIVAQALAKIEDPNVRRIVVQSIADLGRELASASLRAG